MSVWNMKIGPLELCVLSDAHFPSLCSAFFFPQQSLRATIFPSTERSRPWILPIFSFFRLKIVTLPLSRSPHLAPLMSASQSRLSLLQEVTPCLHAEAENLLPLSLIQQEISISQLTFLASVQVHGPLRQGHTALILWLFLLGLFQCCSLHCWPRAFCFLYQLKFKFWKLRSLSYSRSKAPLFSLFPCWAEWAEWSWLILITSLPQRLLLVWPILWVRLFL